MESPVSPETYSDKEKKGWKKKQRITLISGGKKNLINGLSITFHYRARIGECRK
ncbi:MAG: hypothetical protein Phog2KO_50930 [Phototrophicaceae bacterium]